jgi:L-alanine-DL-glutamate epimerase-like enolase superfamily enzyme
MARIARSVDIIQTDANHVGRITAPWKVAALANVTHLDGVA